jgi:hypothetical protein
MTAKRSLTSKAVAFAGIVATVRLPKHDMFRLPGALGLSASLADFGIYERKPTSVSG